MQAVQARHADGIGSALRQLVAAAAADDPRMILEDKGSSLAVHYRLVPQMEQTPQEQDRCHYCAALPSQDLEVMYGKAVIEIKPAEFQQGRGGPRADEKSALRASPSDVRR